jgi:hypothetical protein
MDFYAVLTRVMALLQREGCTSYCALKRQFALMTSIWQTSRWS